MVQGVGFRATAQCRAKKLGLTGIVRNLPEGSVEIIAQGTKAQLSAFVKEIENAFQGRISAIEKIEKTPEKKYDSFQIVR